MMIDKQKYRLAVGQYTATRRPKDLIVLHHTAGGSVGSTFKWWDVGDPRKIGTAYIVDRDGTVYEIFDPMYWAWHLGLKDRGIEVRSIGIELSNAGWLDPTEGGEILKSWWGKEFEIGSPSITAFPGKWREHYHYEAYPQEQIDATCALVVMLCDRFGIPKKLPSKAKPWAVMPA